MENGKRWAWGRRRCWCPRFHGVSRTQPLVRLSFVIGRWTSVINANEKFNRLKTSADRLNPKPGQRLRVFVRIRLLFKTRAAEVLSVPNFQIFQISEDYHLAR